MIDDRYEAIRQAIEIADAKDTILILGKGDEKFIYREFGREPYEGDDSVSREVLEELMEEGYYNEDE